MSQSSVTRHQPPASGDKSHLFSIFAFSVSLWFICTGCIPATVPDNLDDTPGPPVIVADGYYQSDVFSVRYPVGWRIVTSEASAPASVIFVAPDEVSTIRLSVAPMDVSGLDPLFQIEQREMKLSDELTVYAVLHAQAENRKMLQAAFEAVLASLRQGQP
jgi:hypothetical protein